MHSDLVSYLHCISGYRQQEIWFQIPLVNIYEVSLGQFNSLEHCSWDSSGWVEIWYQISSHGDRLIKAVSMSCEAAVPQINYNTLWHFWLHPNKFACCVSVTCLKNIFQVQYILCSVGSPCGMLFYHKNYLQFQTCCNKCETICISIQCLYNDIQLSFLVIIFCGIETYATNAVILFISEAPVKP